MPLPVTFDHCVVHVSDWERSNAFYRDVLGAELVRRPQGWAYRFGAAQLNLQGLRHQRLFPRPRRLAAGIHFLSSQRRRPHLTIAHDPRYRPPTPWRRRAMTERATASAWMAPRATRATAKAEGTA